MFAAWGDVYLGRKARLKMAKTKSNLQKHFDWHYANRGRSLLLAQQLGGACAYAV